MPHPMSQSRNLPWQWGVFIAVVAAFSIWVLNSAEADFQKAKKAKITACQDPVFIQAVGHKETTTWVYACADGSMIELGESLPSAPIGTPDGWAGGR